MRSVADSSARAGAHTHTRANRVTCAIADARSDADASSCMRILHTYVVPWTHVLPVQHSGL